MDIKDSFKRGDCIYCHKEIEKNSWVSDWCPSKDKHYKHVDCPHCSKKNWLSVNFEGSGHDTLMQGKQKNLESVVKRSEGGGS